MLIDITIAHTAHQVRSACALRIEMINRFPNFCGVLQKSVNVLQIFVPPPTNHQRIKIHKVINIGIRGVLKGIKSQS